MNYWVSQSFSKLFSKSYLAWCNSIELLKIILKILLRWILLKGHVPTSLTVLMEDLSQKDFEKDFQNVNRIAKVKNILWRWISKRFSKWSWIIQLNSSPGQWPRHLSFDSSEKVLFWVKTGLSWVIWLLGRQGLAVTLRQHCPQMT